jgi:hypothetical protein
LVGTVATGAEPVFVVVLEEGATVVSAAGGGGLEFVQVTSKTTYPFTTLEVVVKAP